MRRDDYRYLDHYVYDCHCLGGISDSEEGGGEADVAGELGKELRGMWKDDINNWTQSNVWPERD